MASISTCAPFGRAATPIRRAPGGGLGEVAAHDLVDLGEVRQVGEEDVQLGDVVR